MIKLNKSEEKIILSVIAVLVIAAGILKFAAMKPGKIEVNGSGGENQSAVVTREPVKIFVYVTGEVKNPGMYELDEGSRVFDAVKSAGGFTENADTASVNMAEKIKDEQQIVIAPKITDTPQDGTGTVTGTPIHGGKININKATAEELDSFLPGIGEIISKNIVNYRAKNGRFKSIEDIKNVDGIGDGRYQKIKDYITVN